MPATIPSICIEDVLAAQRAVVRGVSMARIIRCAELATEHRAVHGRIHPTYGDGSIMAAAMHLAATLPRASTPAPTDSPEWFRAGAKVHSALADLRCVNAMEAA